MLSVYPDTSFLFSLFLQRPSSAAAAGAFAALPGALPVTTLLLYEFENAARMAAWMHGRDRQKGFSTQVAQIALARLEADLDSGALEIIPCDFVTVINLARKLSNARTWRGGHRSFDLLHIATALHLKAKRFLSFDTAQRELAEAEGLNVGP
jgi:predicted nucleic acid-binding protein